MPPLRWAVFSMCVSLDLRSAPFLLTTCFFHSINLSAGQKELAYTPDLFWFVALGYVVRCFNFKAEKRESFTQVKDNSFLKYIYAGKNELRLDQLACIRFNSPTIVDTQFVLIGVRKDKVFFSFRLRASFKQPCDAQLDSRRIRK